MATADIELDEPKTAATPKREPKINSFFRVVMKHEGSDLHLKAGQPPMMRLKGMIPRIEHPPISAEHIEELPSVLTPTEPRHTLEETGGADSAHVIGPGASRFRVSVLRQRGDLGLVARRVRNKVPTLEKLHLPPSIEKLCRFA